jgi:hypothetical protein
MTRSLRSEIWDLKSPNFSLVDLLVEIKYAASTLPERRIQLQAVRQRKSRPPVSYPHEFVASLGWLARPEVSEEVAEILIAEALEEPFGHE